MGILAAIISVLSAIATAVASALSAIIRVTPYWVWIGFAILLGGIYLGHGCNGMPVGCSLREMACGCRQRDPKPPKSEIFDVASVPSGASLVVLGGLKGRKQFTVALAHIQAPLAGQAAEASRQALEAAAGPQVRIEWARGGFLMGSDNADPSTGQRRLEAEEDPEQTTAETTGQGGNLEARPPSVGIAYNLSGVMLNMNQVLTGQATLAGSAPEDWVKQAKRR